MITLLKKHLLKQEIEQIITLIEEHPEVLKLKDENGSSGLMMIAYSNLKVVLAKAIDLKTSFTFHEAIVCGQSEIVKTHLAEESSNLVSTYSNDGFAPLALAAFFNQTDIAKQLLAVGADPNLAATNPSRVNALHAAVAKENYELCKILIEHEANVNAPQMQNVTPLHSAVHRGNLELTQLLVESGATISSKMDNGDTALAIAQREGHEAIIAYLLN